MPLSFSGNRNTRASDLLTFGFSENKAQMSVALGQLEQPVGAAVDSGFNGAPLLDRSGKLVGMVRIEDKSTGEINVVSSATLKAALRRFDLARIQRSL
jgi:hypothetical protein